MALIADCNSTTVVVDGVGYIDNNTLNAPMQKNSMGEMDFFFHDRALFECKYDGQNICVQTVTGINEDTNLLMTQVQRFSSSVKGQVVGTDWSEWTKIV